MHWTREGVHTRVYSGLFKPVIFGDERNLIYQRVPVRLVAERLQIRVLKRCQRSFRIPCMVVLRREDVCRRGQLVCEVEFCCVLWSLRWSFVFEWETWFRGRQELADEAYGTLPSTHLV